MFLEPEKKNDTTTVQPRVQAGSGPSGGGSWGKRRPGGTRLGSAQTVLRRWIQQYRDQAEEAFPGQGKLTPADDEVRRLKREVARLKAERDILKKAAAYFARDPL